MKRNPTKNLCYHPFKFKLTSKNFNDIIAVLKIKKEIKNGRK